jgi:branched-chain amino acid transport system ATP-binding protein
VLIEHDMPLVSSIADELVCLHVGSVIARGRPSDVLDDPDVLRAYLGAPPVPERRRRPNRPLRARLQPAR